MKSRREVFEEITAETLRCISEYKTMLPEQVYRLFPEYDQAFAKSILTRLIQRRRVFYNSAMGFLAASDTITLPDKGMLAALWVMLERISEISYHSPSNYPVQICYIAGDELHDIIHVGPGEELLVSHALSAAVSEEHTRTIIVESLEQIKEIDCPGNVRFCVVGREGQVKYYRKKEGM